VAEVYAIGFPNGKLYIGITTRTTEQRFRGHVKDMQRGSTYTVHKALRKYGPDSVRLVTLHSGVTDDEAKERGDSLQVGQGSEGKDAQPRDSCQDKRVSTSTP